MSTFVFAKEFVRLKDELAEKEKSDDWVAITNFLMGKWQKDKLNPELSALIIDEMSFFLLSLMERKSAVFSKANTNNENERLYMETIKEILSFGVNHYIGNEYFVWRLVNLLLGVTDYYFLEAIAGLVDTDGLENYCKEVIAKVMEDEHGDNALLQYTYAAISASSLMRTSTNSEEKERLRIALEHMNLRENFVDVEIRFFFDWVFA